MEIITATSEEDAARREARNDALKNLAFILIAVGAAYGLTVSIGIDGLERLVGQAGVWGVLATIALKMTTIIVVPLSGGPIYAIAGAAFGFWKGFAITSLGDILGFSVAFYLSRFFGRNVISALVPRAQLPFVEKLLVQGSSLKSFLKARVAFSGFPEVFAYAAGLTQISFLIFIATQMVFHVPAAALVVLFGNAILTENPLIFFGATITAVLLAVVGGWWFKRDLTQEA
ncbi:MAG: hypothetical protein G01um101449_4 [Parcubacteria group bacterium Gr01-1014_49]|nr:MAG: hypothetical protein G01um101449_4 [Parcubacteria group bacterium Gr01-1014_49]